MATPARHVPPGTPVRRPQLDFSRNFRVKCSGGDSRKGRTLAIRQILNEVLGLQLVYKSENSSEMSRRGILVRDSIATFIGAQSVTLSALLGISPNDFLVEGKDGIGRKSKVPWIRFASNKRSPSATTGWYAVLLFREDGSGLYLAIAHASTENNNGTFHNRSLQERNRLMGWARSILSKTLQSDSRLVRQIFLGSGKLAKAYELTTVAAYFYPTNSLPSDDALSTDLGEIAKILGSIYANEDQQARAGETSLDVIAAIGAAEDSTERRERNASQGFGLTQPERRAVERRAMLLAKQHLEGLGYTVKDTSARYPYDFLATRHEEVLHIEVKGTTGERGDIVLTKNEVSLHLGQYPDNGLIIVDRIRLIGDGEMVDATDGNLSIAIPWKIEDSELQPISYRYRTDRAF